MALIICPECGAEISDQAEVCMRCGYPVRKRLQEQQRRTEQIARKAEKEAGKQPVPKLKLILVIVFGCLCILPQLISKILYFDPGQLSMPLYIFRDFVVDFLIYAGIFLAVVQKKIPAIIVSACYIFLMSVIIVITVSPVYSYDWVSYTMLFLLAGLTIVYAALGLKARNSIVFLILSETLMVADIIYLLIRYPFMVHIVTLLLYICSLCYYFVSFSPDKWWRRRSAPSVPPVPDSHFDNQIPE